MNVNTLIFNINRAMTDLSYRAKTAENPTDREFLELRLDRRKAELVELTNKINND